MTREDLSHQLKKAEQLISFVKGNESNQALLDMLVKAELIWRDSFDKVFKYIPENGEI